MRSSSAIRNQDGFDLHAGFGAGSWMHLTAIGRCTALHNAIHDALKTDAVRAGFAKLTLEPAETSPAGFAELIVSDSERWAKVVKSTGFKPIE